jgi:tRNA uridine 5-carbamoylmethylation protein Kti12
LALDSLSQGLREKRDEPSVFIVDDIMYFRSMRKEIYKLARDHSAAYITIKIRVSLETALLRNQLRQNEAILPEEV